ncbi:hypothetical protein C8R43DRAFT_1193935 [Mycena crocata]|nr:hypothetical protein C8R43DRAFT_1193935 [Mycena crocata]
MVTSRLCGFKRVFFLLIVVCILAVFHNTLVEQGGNGILDPQWRWAQNVDFVFAWVNGSDSEWLTRRSTICPSCPMHSTANDRSNDELKYSLRSIAEYLPWHQGRLIFVTPGQVPSWLNTAHPRVKMVNQDNIVPANVGFTVNTFVISWHLDHIPDLSEHFVYIEDDNFADSPVHPSTFFTQDRAIRFFDNAHFSNPAARFQNATREEADDAYRSLLAGETSDGYDVAGQQTSAALKEVFGDPQAFFFYPKHVPMVLRRSLFPPARLLFSEYLRPMHAHKRRHPLSVLPAETLRSVALKLTEENVELKLAEVAPPEECEGRFLTEVVSDDIHRNDKLFTRLLGPERGTHAFFSLNDVIQLEAEIAGKQLRQFLETRYPVASEFELL